MQKVKNSKNSLFAKIFKVILIVLIVLAVYFIVFKVVELIFPRMSLNDKKGLRQSYHMTLMLTVFGSIIGIVVGFLLVILRMLNIKVVNIIVNEYIDIVRGTPLTMQLLIFSLIIFASLRNGEFWIAALVFGLNSSAYVAEIVRGGIESLDKGQVEAAKALGMPQGMTMKLIVIPQVIKNVIPMLVNEFIVLFKETSIVGYISVVDLTKFSKELQSNYFSPVPLVLVGLIYYVSVKGFSVIAKMIERQLKNDD